jgi:hypothetical protein
MEPLSCIIVSVVKIIYFTKYRYFTFDLEKGEVVLAKNLEIAYLLDFYGEMLTKKQRDFIDLYYNEDLSLSEIAENEGITRQGVRDSIKRAEVQLFEMEQKLGLAQRFAELKDGLDEIKECAEAIYTYNLEHSLSREINDNVAKIKSIAEFLGE